MNPVAAEEPAVGHFLPGQQVATPGQPRTALDFTEITAPVVREELYNPDPDEPVIMEFAAEMYVIPPRDKKLVYTDPFTHDQVPYHRPGVCPIYDRVERHASGKRYTILARDIVKFFLGEDGRSGAWGIRGVRALFRDERDEAVMREAEEVFLLFRDQEDTILTKRHENAVELARENAATAPRPGPDVVKAYARLARRDATNLFKYACEICNEPFREEMGMLAHIVSMHKKHPAAVAAARALELDKPSTKPEYVPPAPKGKLPTAAEVKAALDEVDEEVGGLEKTAAPAVPPPPPAKK